MAVQAGYTTTIKLTGTSTAFTGAATTTLAAGTYAARRQITAAAQRILDPAAGLTVRDGVSVVPAGNYTVDYLSGIISFTVAPAGVVTVDGSYLPLLTVGECQSASVSSSRDELDRSVYGDADKRYELGLKQAEVTLERLELHEDDLDPGAGTTTFDALCDAGTPKLVEVGLGGGRYWRGWCVFPSLASAASPSDLLKGTVRAKTVVLNAAGRNERVSSAFGTS